MDKEKILSRSLILGAVKKASEKYEKSFFLSMVLESKSAMDTVFSGVSKISFFRKLKWLLQNVPAESSFANSFFVKKALKIFEPVAAFCLNLFQKTNNSSINRRFISEFEKKPIAYVGLTALVVVAANTMGIFLLLHHVFTTEELAGRIILLAFSAICCGMAFSAEDLKKSSKLVGLAFKWWDEQKQSM